MESGREARRLKEAIENYNFVVSKKLFALELEKMRRRRRRVHVQRGRRARMKQEKDFKGKVAGFLLLAKAQTKN